MPLLTHDETGAASIARANARGVSAREGVNLGARVADPIRSGGIALSERPTEVTPVVRGAGGSFEDARKKKSPASPWKIVRRGLLVLLGLIVLGPFLAFAIGWMLFSVPSAEDVALNQVATFNFADQPDVPLAVSRPENADTLVPENRVIITLDQVPEHVKNAVLAAEDRTFFTNPGFDITGIARAVFNQLTGGAGGGSTITQQYVKVSTGRDEVSLIRKYREVIVAVKISREQTKEKILENYLNTIFWGRSSYGLQAAAGAYFDKDVANLTPSEGAMLAGLIQAPGRWDPAKSPEDTQRRWEFVMNEMAEAGWLSQTDRAAAVFPDNWLREAPAAGGLPEDDRFHIYELALEELAEQGITEEQIARDGLTVTTTINSERQRQAVEAVRSRLDEQPENLRSAVVSIDPRTGAILAYYGGSDGLGLNYAARTFQPGSTFKPFVFAAALQSDTGVGLGSTYDGRSGQTFPGKDEPVNNAGESSDCGSSCNVKTAMTNSVNTVFYQMGIDVGPQKVIDTAVAAGVSPDPPLVAQGGIALGDQPVSPLDMALAYSTLAAEGQRHEAHIVSKVVTADGRVLFERTAPAGTEAMPQQVARNVTESMLDVATRSKFTLTGGRVAAAKTGTTQGNGDANKDAWTVGYTPSLVTAVWVGTDQNDPLVDRNEKALVGGSVAGPIWKAYMDAALAGTPREQFSRLVPMGKALGSAARNNRSTDRQQNPVRPPAQDDRQQQGQNDGGNQDNNGGDQNNGDNQNNGDASNNNNDQNNNNDNDNDEENIDENADGNNGDDNNRNGNNENGNEDNNGNNDDNQPTGGGPVGRIVPAVTALLDPGR